MSYAHQVLNIAPPALPTFPPARNGVQQAIARASEKTGVDFSYLIEKANVESSMNPQAKSKNSSASGLYQFIEKTWLQMVRDYGHKYGLSDYANSIDQNCRVKNDHLRQTILDLRHDPETSACMAAEYAAQNADILKSRIGDDVHIGKTELYLAHFLGAGGATKFLTAMERNPHARAASVFPVEARTNTGVFYDRETGRARTLSQIYDHFATKFETTSTIKDTAMTASSRNTSRPPRAYTESPEGLSSTGTEAVLPTTPLNDPWIEGTPVAGLPPQFIDELLATPPRPFGAGSPSAPANDALAFLMPPHRLPQMKPAPSAPSAIAAAQETARTIAATSLHQSALLVLAQNFAHEDNKRYNG